MRPPRTSAAGRTAQDAETTRRRADANGSGARARGARSRSGPCRPRVVVSSLRTAAEDYLRMRRALGYKLEGPGRQLEQFVTYLEQTAAHTVTIENALAWATLPAGADPGYWAGERKRQARRQATDECAGRRVVVRARQRTARDRLEVAAASGVDPDRVAAPVGRVDEDLHRFRCRSARGAGCSIGWGQRRRAGRECPVASSTGGSNPCRRCPGRAPSPRWGTGSHLPGSGPCSRCRRRTCG